MNYMRFNIHLLQPVYHGPTGERQHYRVKALPVQVLQQAQQMRFAATDLALANTFQYFYFSFV